MKLHDPDSGSCVDINLASRESITVLQSGCRKLIMRL